jgi:hypothetical protein
MIQMEAIASQQVMQVQFQVVIQVQFQVVIRVHVHLDFNIKMENASKQFHPPIQLATNQMETIAALQVVT